MLRVLYNACVRNNFRFLLYLLAEFFRKGDIRDLVLHTGAEPIEYDELRELPIPAATSTHVPIPTPLHSDEDIDSLVVAPWQFSRSIRQADKAADRLMRRAPDQRSRNLPPPPFLFRHRRARRGA
jgi:hypothetical protein